MINRKEQSLARSNDYDVAACLAGSNITGCEFFFGVWADLY